MAERVAQYFFGDARFADPLEQWVERHAGEVRDDDEFELSYTDLYEDFKSLYEKLLEAYIESQGVTVKAFFDELRCAVDKDPDSSEALLAQIVLATTDFDIFINM